MYFTPVFLFIVSAAFVNADLGAPQVQVVNNGPTEFVDKVDDDNVPSIDEQVEPLGTDNVFCLFTYGNWVMPATMQQDVPNAIYSGVARLPYHRLDFNYYSQDLQGSFPTIVPDCGYEVWGSIYLIPVTDLDTVLLKGGIVDGKKVFHFVQTVVEAYSNGNVINVKCNAFQQTSLPDKVIYGLPLPQDRRPSQQIIDMLVESYQDGGLPQKYIDEVSQIPTLEQGYIETNQVQQPQQNPTVVVAPDSVVVAPDSVVVAPDSVVVDQNQDQQVQVTPPYGVPPMPHNQP
ncbi:uncharacterized protein LOC135844678 [Planococcus citri]|uniref:uncharacterized protein LOC135844678 n=1 Tax=Planococcus citri TaxID=170843 RepID=UPI0031F86384